MIDYELYCRIKDLRDKDRLTIVQIARQLHLNERTVGRWLAADRFRPRASPPRPSILDGYKGQIVRWLDSHPYTAAQIYLRLREAGYAGGMTIVKEHIRQIRPPHTPAFLTLAFAPGEAAQVDWGQFGSINVGHTRRRLSFFVMVLCYSRMLYVQFTVSETMEHFLACHANAFAFFGGVPGKVMVDNLKSAVLRRIIGQTPVLNPHYKDFADHYGFDIAPCGVGQAHEKGRVENAVGYVKKNFLAGLELTDFPPVNPAVRQWLDTVANVRVHGSTRRRPVDLFSAEKLRLRALPSRPYDVGVIRPGRASSQFRVTVDANTYSVPAEYAGAALTVKLYPDVLCFYHQDKLIARHVRCYDRHQDFEDPDHPRALLAQRRKARDQKLFQRLLALTPKAESFYLGLQERRFNVLHHVRKIVALSEIYGTEKTARAIEDALEFGAFSCEYIANLLEQRQRLLPEPGALHLTRRADLLELELPEPDLGLYDPAADPQPHPDPSSEPTAGPPAPAADPATPGPAAPDAADGQCPPSSNPQPGQAHDPQQDQSGPG
jgi:transposase